MDSPTPNEDKYFADRREIKRFFQALSSHKDSAQHGNQKTYSSIEES